MKRKKKIIKKATKKSTSRKFSDNLSILSRAEVVITSDLKQAVALEHIPGQTPKVLIKSNSDKIANLILRASQLQIPIVESKMLTSEIFSKLKETKPIPPEFYALTAQCLALVYKTKPSPQLIRYVKVISKVPEKRESAFTLVADVLPLVEITPLKLEFGTALAKEKNFFSKPLNHLRQKIALELGLVLPEIKITKNPHLKPWEYLIKLKEINYLQSEIQPGPTGKDNLLNIISKLKQTIYNSAAELLDYTQTQLLLENLEKSKPQLVKELFPKHFSITALRVILRNLLKEQISIRNLGTILETILENLSLSSDPDILTEYIRIAFKTYLCQKYQDQEGFLNVILLDPLTERKVLKALKEKGKMHFLDLKPEEALEILKSIGEQLKNMESMGISVVLLCSPTLRRFIHRLIEHTFPQLPVLAYSEIAPLCNVRTTGTI